MAIFHNYVSVPEGIHGFLPIGFWYGGAPVVPSPGETAYIVQLIWEDRRPKKGASVRTRVTIPHEANSSGR